MIKLGANELATLAAYVKAFKVLKSPVVLDLADADGAIYLRMRAAGPGVALLAAPIPLETPDVQETTRLAVHSDNLAEAFARFAKGDTVELEFTADGLGVFQCATGLSRINIPVAYVPPTYANAEPLTRAAAGGTAKRLIPTLLDVGAVTAWRIKDLSWGALTDVVRLSRDGGDLVADCTNSSVLYSGRVPCDFSSETPDDFQAYVSYECVQILKKLHPIWGSSGPVVIRAGEDRAAVLASASTPGVLVGTNAITEYPDVGDVLKRYLTDSELFLTCDRASLLGVLKIMNRGGPRDKLVTLTLDGAGRVDLKTSDGLTSFEGVRAEGGPGTVVVELRYLLDAVGRMAGTDLEIRATYRMIGMTGGNLTALIGRLRGSEAEDAMEAEEDKLNQ
jgi:hypothetical protein